MSTQLEGSTASTPYQGASDAQMTASRWKWLALLVGGLVLFSSFLWMAQERAQSSLMVSLRAETHPVPGERWKVSVRPASSSTRTNMPKRLRFRWMKEGVHGQLMPIANAPVIRKELPQKSEYDAIWIPVPARGYLRGEGLHLQVETDRVFGQVKGTQKMILGQERAQQIQLLTVLSKPLYQPGQRVRVMLFARDLLTGRPVSDLRVSLKLYKHRRSPVHSTASLALSEHGTASHTFLLKKTVKPGKYSLQVRWRGRKAWTTFTVSRYTKPHFKVSVKAQVIRQKGALVLRGVVRARAFHGTPLRRAAVSLSITSRTSKHKRKGRTDKKGHYTFSLPWSSGSSVSVSAEVRNTAGMMERASTRASGIFQPSSQPKNDPIRFTVQAVQDGVLASRLPTRLLLEAKPAKRGVFGFSCGGQEMKCSLDLRGRCSLQVSLTQAEIAQGCTVSTDAGVLARVPLPLGASSKWAARLLLARPLYRRGEPLQGWIGWVNKPTKISRAWLQGASGSVWSALPERHIVPPGKWPWKGAAARFLKHVESFRIPAPKGQRGVFHLHLASEAGLIAPAATTLVMPAPEVAVSTSIKKTYRPGELASPVLTLRSLSGREHKALVGIDVTDDRLQALHPSKDPFFRWALPFLSPLLKRQRKGSSLGQKEQRQIFATVWGHSSSKVDKRALSTRLLMAYQPPRKPKQRLKWTIVLSSFPTLQRAPMIDRRLDDLRSFVALLSGVLLPLLALLIGILGWRWQRQRWQWALEEGAIDELPKTTDNAESYAWIWLLLLSFVGHFVFVVLLYSNDSPPPPIDFARDRFARLIVTSQDDFIDMPERKRARGGAYGKMGARSRGVLGLLAQKKLLMRKNLPLSVTRPRWYFSLLGATASQQSVSRLGWGGRKRVYGRGGWSGHVRRRKPRPVFHVRKNFSEILFWKQGVGLSTHSKKKLAFSTGDAITQWTLRARGLTLSGQPLYHTDSFQVKQPFFLSFQPPQRLLEGDWVSIPAVIHNESSKALWVHVSASTVMPKKLSVSLGRKRVKVAAHSTSRVMVKLRARQQGQVQLLLSAHAGTMGDRLLRKISIKPVNKAVHISRSGLLGDTTHFPFELSKNVRLDTLKLFVSVHTKAGAAKLSYASLLRRPHGCFEQTTSSTGPNVLLSLLLSGATKPRHRRILTQAQAYMRQGYKRMLRFEHKSGGFSLYPPRRMYQPDVRLTAYGLSLFADMRRAGVKAGPLIGRAVRWLLKQRRSDGSFGSIRQTSMVVAALRKAGWREGLAQSEAWLLARSRQVHESHRLVRLAMALPSTHQRQLWPLLLRQMTHEQTLALAEGRDLGVKGRRALSSWAGSYGQTLALLTLAHATRMTKDLPTSLWLGHRLRWIKAIASRQSHYGGWGTTELTLAALRALDVGRRFGLLTPVSVQLVGLGTGAPRELMRQVVTHSTSLALGDVLRRARRKGIRRFRLSLKPLHVAKGKRKGLFLARLSYVRKVAASVRRRPWLEATLTPRLSRIRVGQSYLLQVKLTNTKPFPLAAPMGVLFLPPGVSLEGIEGPAHKAVAKHDTKGDKLHLYIRTLKPKESISFHLRLKATLVTRAFSGPQTFYPYYNPEKGVELASYRLVVDAK